MRTAPIANKKNEHDNWHTSALKTCRISCVALRGVALALIRSAKEQELPLIARVWNMRKPTGKLFPTRSIQHISETDSVQLLHGSLPADWVFRGVTERDYGVDALIEITNNGRMTGNMLAAQVKGVRSFRFSNKDERTFAGLRRSTYNYLLGLPIASYLFICSLADRRVYWVSLREHERRRTKADRSSEWNLNPSTARSF